jgi:CelD/BcsL family acetyltransferase involved in cellulose biosynthesis
MNIAVNYHLNREEIAPEPVAGAGRLAKVVVLEDLRAAEPFWRHLERTDAWATPYQRFDLLAAWQHHVGVRKGITPFIVIGLDDSGEPLFLLPFGSKRTGPFRLVRFLGSKHASFNIGLWRRDLVASVTAEDIADVFARIAAGGHRIDLLALFSQPLSWAGIANPLACLRHQLSVDQSLRLTVTPAAGARAEDTLTPSMRTRIRKKERKLRALAGYRYLKATAAADIDRLLDRFFALKAVHMSSQGLGNVFAEPGVADFLRQACHVELPGGRPLIEIHALEADGEVLALYGAVVDDLRFSSMFNTYTLGQHARHSPGLILLQHMIGDCAQRRLHSFDLGVGRAHYKSFFCKEPEPLFDTFLALTPRGQLAAPAFRATFAAKRMIKAKPLLWAGVQFLRRFRAS